MGRMKQLEGQFSLNSLMQLVTSCAVAVVEHGM
jgi:hypothetical protein